MLQPRITAQIENYLDLLEKRSALAELLNPGISANYIPQATYQSVLDKIAPITQQISTFRELATVRFSGEQTIRVTAASEKFNTVMLQAQDLMYKQIAS
jgi:hypothetical protein